MGFVEGRHIMKLRQQLQKHGYSHSFTTDEKGVFKSAVSSGIKQKTNSDLVVKEVPHSETVVSSFHLIYHAG